MGIYKPLSIGVWLSLAMMLNIVGVYNAMTMEKQLFEDVHTVSPIKNCDFPMSCQFSPRGG